MIDATTSSRLAVESLVAQIADEFVERYKQGEAPDVEEYAARHPEHATVLREVLAALKLVRLSGVSGSDWAPSEESFAGTVGDFRLIREIGRGGMGIVYEAEQISLRRRVALKVLPFAATLDPKRLQRFRNEAQAVAQLHHTNIVPVFAVGCERAIHYYAMQYIEGQTLAAVIEDLCRQAAPNSKPTTSTSAANGRQSAPSEAAPAVDAPTKTLVGLTTERSTRSKAFFHTVAELGVQTAEALDYAHEMGIVHRDVKPANLLVDARRNLWITDFGLAQIQTEASLTLTGDLIGTVRYMSPEQALGNRDGVDRKTDIYSLGVTLYELLTLQPPFGGADRQKLLRQIALAEPRPARSINSAIPVELETIVLKALEKNPADRYASAQALADDLRRYLMNEPIRARRSSLVQRARKVARRHPGVTATVAIALVVGLLLGVAGLAVNNRLVRQEQLRTRQALNGAEREKANAQQEKAIAQAVRDFLRKLLAQTDPRVQAKALPKGGSKSAAAKPNPTIRELLDRAAGELAPDNIDDQFPGQALVQAEILKTIGEAYGAIGEYGPAVAHLDRARDLQERALASGHAETLATLESLGRIYLDMRKPTEAARLFEQVNDRRFETLGPDHSDTLASMNDLARSYFALGRHAEALKLRQQIVPLRRTQLGPDDPDTLASMNNLANSYAKLGQFDKALELHQETLERRQAKLGVDNPDTLQSMNNVANSFSALDRRLESLEVHAKALDLRRAKLGSDDPETLQSMNNVAMAYYLLGRYADALKLHSETLAGREKKLHLEHPDTQKSMNTLAWLLTNCPEQKLRDPARALELAKRVVARAPKNGDFQNTLGVARYRTGDWQGAIAALTESVKLREGGDGTDWFFLAMAHRRLGDKDQARSWYDKAVEWMEKKKSQDAELRQFRAEAAEVLGVASGRD